MIKILIALFLLVVLWLSLHSLERRSLYYPDKTLIANPRSYRLTYENVQLQAEDGTNIYGWYIPGTKSLTILLCHGNAGNISHRLDKAARLHKTGVNILLFDYRGYGQSEGHPTEAGTYQDAEAAYRFLIQTKEISPHRIVFYGESLGCAVALEMALRHPGGAGLILESAFTSTIAMAKRIFPWLPVKWIIRYRYDNLAKIPHLEVPLLLMHSRQDEIVPFGMGQQLFVAAPEPKRFFELVGGHNEGYADSGDGYIDAVKGFLHFIEGTHDKVAS